MCENLQHESVYFKKLHKDQGYNGTATYRAGAAVASIFYYYWHYPVNTVSNVCPASYNRSLVRATAYKLSL